MTFTEHYQKLPNIKAKRKFRKSIIEICKIEHSTFYTWLHRGIFPPLAQKVISEFMQKGVTELFPEHQTV